MYYSKNTSLRGLNITISIAICVLISFILLLQINISQVFQVSSIPNKNAVTVPLYWYYYGTFFSGPIVKVIPRHNICISETLMFSAAFFKKKKKSFHFDLFDFLEKKYFFWKTMLGSSLSSNFCWWLEPQSVFLPSAY